jgi:hypothetical protein
VLKAYLGLELASVLIIPPGGRTKVVVAHS